MKTILLGTTMLFSLSTVALAQSATYPEQASQSALSFGGASITFGANVQQDTVELNRGGAWSGPVAESQAAADLEIQSVNLSATATFENGSFVTFSYGRITDIGGQNYGFNGQDSTKFLGGEGDIFGFSAGAALGGGFAVEGGLRVFDMKATEFEHPSRTRYTCPSPVTNSTSQQYDVCQFVHEMVMGDIVVSYSAPLSGSAFYTLGGGMRFTNGYSKQEYYDAGGTNDRSENVAPLFSIDPVLTGEIGYSFGAYEVTAGAMLVGDQVSYSVGVNMATGQREMADALMGELSFGAFLEHNRFGAQRQVAWTADINLTDGDYGEMKTETSTIGLQALYSTETTDVRFGLGAVVGGQGYFIGNQNNGGQHEWHMEEGSGVHVAAAVSTDLMPVGTGLLRADAEIDYIDLSFDKLVRVQPTNSNRTYNRSTTQTLTAAFGASYHMMVAPGMTGYAGLDYIVSGSRNVFHDPNGGNNNSNYTSAFEDSYRVRLGGSYDMGGMAADFEVSGNHIAGASVAGGVSWKF